MLERGIATGAQLPIVEEERMLGEVLTHVLVVDHRVDPDRLQPARAQEHR
jgi:hypothetical protein